jgi:DNA-directed RNA polymerase specialized sigma24 family protein
VVRRRRPAGELTEAVPDAGLGPHGSVVLREEVGATLEAIRALPDWLARLLLLREVSGPSYDELAAVVGTPADAAAMRCSRPGPR